MKEDNKKLKIGLDFDGVIANTINVKQKLAKKFYNVDIPSNRFKEYMVIEDGLLTHEQYRKLMNNVCGNFDYGLEMKEVKDSVQVIKNIISLGCDVCVITSREGDEVKVAEEWCKKRGLDLKFISVGYGKDKLESAKDLDIYVDDDVPKLVPLIDVVPNIFLWSNEHNKGHVEPEGVIRMDLWGEFEKKIKYILNFKNEQ